MGFCSAETYQTFMLVFITAFLFADQNLIAPSLTYIAREFEIDEEDKDYYLGGFIAIGFFLVGAPVSLLIGFLVDFVNRRNLFVITIVLGELACGLTYFAANYEQLFALRSLTGIAIGGALPLVMGMLGDLYDEKKRAKVAGYVGLAMALGGGAGQQIAIIIIAATPEGEDPDWRLPFLVVSLPSIFFALIYYFTTEDPQRGRSEKALKKKFEEAEEQGESLDYAERMSWDKFKRIWSHKTTLLVFTQGIPGSVPWGIMITYFTDFLIQDRGLGAGTVALMNISFGVGIAAGQVIGGWVGDLLYSINKRYVPYCMAITTITGVYPIMLMINIENLAWWVYALAGLPSGILVAITGANGKAILLNVTLPELRGTVFGIFNLMDDLGRGLGPFVVAVIINLAGSREAGFNFALIGWGLCGFINFFIAFTLEKDANDLQKTLQTATLLSHDMLEEESNGKLSIVAGKDDYYKS